MSAFSTIRFGLSANSPSLPSRAAARDALDTVQLAGDAMAERLASLALTLRERGYDDAPHLEQLVRNWRELR